MNNHYTKFEYKGMKTLELKITQMDTTKVLRQTDRWICLFVCFVALRPKSTAVVMAGRSVHLGKFEQAVNQYFVHTQVTDNTPRIIQQKVGE